MPSSPTALTCSWHITARKTVDARDHCREAGRRHGLTLPRLTKVTAWDVSLLRGSRIAAYNRSPIVCFGPGARCFSARVVTRHAAAPHGCFEPTLRNAANWVKVGGPKDRRPWPADQAASVSGRLKLTSRVTCQRSSSKTKSMLRSISIFGPPTGIFREIRTWPRSPFTVRLWIFDHM